MTDAGLRDWPPGLTDLRLACEECHKRKIRCEAPQDGAQGSCQACRANGRTCLFSLKNKTGRPRKSKPAQFHWASKAVSPRPLGAHERPGSPLDSVAAVRSYGIARGLSMEQHEPGGQSAMAEHYADTLPCDTGLKAPGGPPYFRQLPWPPEFATGRDVLDPLPGSTPGGEEQAPSPGLFHLGDDFVFDMPESVTNTKPAFSAISHNDTLELDQGRETRPHLAALRTTLSPDEASDAGGFRDSGRTDSVHTQADTVTNASWGKAMRGDFSDLMRLCGEMTPRYQSKVLDVAARADKQELAVVVGNMEELGHKAAAAMHDAATTASASSGAPPSRQEQYQWMLTRVAVLGAVDIAADLVQHNLAINKIEARGAVDATAANEADIEDGSDLSMTDATAALSTRFGAQGDHGEEDALGGGRAADSLESVLALVRLDHALLQFSLFLMADQCDVEGCGDPCRGIGSSTSRPGHSCPGRTRTSTLDRLEQIRAQAWALAEGMRRLW